MKSVYRCGVERRGGKVMGDLSQDDMNDDQMGDTGRHRKEASQAIGRQATKSRLAQAVGGHNTRSNSNNRRALDAE